MTLQHLSLTVEKLCITITHAIVEDFKRPADITNFSDAMAQADDVRLFIDAFIFAGGNLVWLRKQEPNWVELHKTVMTVVNHRYGMYQVGSFMLLSMSLDVMMGSTRAEEIVSIAVDKLTKNVGKYINGYRSDPVWNQSVAHQVDGVKLFIVAFTFAGGDSTLLFKKTGAQIWHQLRRTVMMMVSKNASYDYHIQYSFEALEKSLNVLLTNVPPPVLETVSRAVSKLCSTLTSVIAHSDDSVMWNDAMAQSVGIRLFMDAIICTGGDHMVLFKQTGSTIWTELAINITKVTECKRPEDLDISRLVDFVKSLKVLIQFVPPDTWRAYQPYPGCLDLVMGSNLITQRNITDGPIVQGNMIHF